LAETLWQLEHSLSEMDENTLKSTRLKTFLFFFGIFVLTFVLVRLVAPTVNSWSRSPSNEALNRWFETIPGAIVSSLFLVGVLWLLKMAGEKTREATERLRIDAEQEVRTKPEKAKPAWDLARLTLESYFNRNLSQIGWIFWLSIVVMVAGFCVIVWGVSQSIAIANQATKEDTTTAVRTFPSVIATAAGLITEFIGATFLFIYRSTIQQATNYSKTLERINSVGMAMQILDTMPEQTPVGDLKSETKAKLIELLVKGAHDQKAMSEAAVK
jgi:nitrate reductase gamma subunit